MVSMAPWSDLRRVFLALFLSFLARIFFYPASFFPFPFPFLLSVWEAEMDGEKRSKKDAPVWDSYIFLQIILRENPGHAAVWNTLGLKNTFGDFIPSFGTVPNKNILCSMTCGGN